MTDPATLDPLDAAIIALILMFDELADAIEPDPDPRDRPAPMWPPVEDV